MEDGIQLHNMVFIGSKDVAEMLYVGIQMWFLQGK